MKLLYYIEQDSPDTRYYIGLFKNLQKNGCSIIVVNILKADSFIADIKEYIDIYYQLELKSYAQSILKLNAIIKKEQPDIVNGIETIPTFYAVLSKLLFFQSHRIVYCRRHGSFKVLSRKQQFMEKIAVALSNLVITVSPSVEIIAQNEHHYFKNKITHVLSGVSVIGNSKNEPLNYKKRNKEITITLISRLRPDKGHIEAFQAVKLLKAQFPSLRLLIAGSGPEKINFEHLIQKEKLEKEVIFLGKVDNVKDLFDTTDIVIIPSYYDACPKTAIEALECGKAIIASYTEGLKDLIISNETGIHIQPKNHLELANAIDLLINNKDLRKKLEQNAKKDYFNRLTPEIMANEYYLKYKDLIQD